MLYDFKFDLNAAESSRRINDAFGKDTVSEQWEIGSPASVTATILKINRGLAVHLPSMKTVSAR